MCKGQPLATVLEAMFPVYTPHGTSSKAVQLTVHQQHTILLCSLT